MADDRTTTVAELRELVRAFVAERRWEKYHTPRNLAASVAVEAGELLELFQWLTPEEAEAARREGPLRAQVADEVADVLAYVLALANVLELDLARVLEQKFAKNRQKYPPEEYRGRYSRP
ncbi:MAG: nucleotide pyrophosphohydrolase [Planctomycetes bacterium]|nr:nucleotide pyrophosphohydrolase [Planctomycetota bacterium]